MGLETYNVKIINFENANKANKKIKVLSQPRVRATGEDAPVLDIDRTPLSDKIELLQEQLDTISNDPKASKKLLAQIEELQERLANHQIRRMAARKRHLSNLIRNNPFDLFITLTYNPEKVNDPKDFEEMSRHFEKNIEAMRKKYGKFDYIAIPELHKKGGVHWHILTNNLKADLVPARYVKGASKGHLYKKSGKQVYWLSDWKLGYTTVTKIEDKEATSNYITKYVTKELDEIQSGTHKKRYRVSKGLKVPGTEFLMVSDEELTELDKTKDKDHYWQSQQPQLVDEETGEVWGGLEDWGMIDDDRKGHVMIFEPVPDVRIYDYSDFEFTTGYYNLTPPQQAA